MRSAKVALLSRSERRLWALRRLLIDDGKTTERYGIGYSACVLIDREGKVLSVYKNSLVPPAEIEKLLEARE